MKASTCARSSPRISPTPCLTSSSVILPELPSFHTPRSCSFNSPGRSPSLPSHFASHPVFGAISSTPPISNTTARIAIPPSFYLPIPHHPYHPEPELAQPKPA